MARKIIGKIVRIGEGSSALMKVERVRRVMGKNRFYGQHWCGDPCGAWQDQTSAATKKDLKTWSKGRIYRR